MDGLYGGYKKNDRIFILSKITQKLDKENAKTYSHEEMWK
ncbi:hypothetical protein A1E_05130 [Rickettsia canadensis str. McKiel]|uniref:Uncharacterized protein n=1 Tax=Rickettsia canadensis (strain McKiel) TaxID=293613 RepID=A8F009_RICCK|nr:hypothetical protein A1E_05130 [Rickettsia canadensis str. McKiel]